MTTRVLLRSFAPLLVLGFVALSFDEASARAGRGRSFGSGGTRSYSGATRPAPTYDSRRLQQRPPAAQAQPFGLGQQGGGFLRGLAGGVVGGLLGGMLFRSLGFAGPAGGLGGGFGLFELALLAGGAYLLYRFVAARRRTAPAQARSGLFGMGSPEVDDPQRRYGSPAPESYAPAPAPPEDELAEGVARIRQFDPAFDEARFREAAQDIFFRVQGAWTRRDLSSVQSLLGDDVRRTLQADVDEMRARGEVNRLENIAVREAELVEAWQDQGQDWVTLRLLANLLDYTTDEGGQLRSGSDSDPVKFEEYWTFARPIGTGAWKLTAIQQA